MTNMTTAHDRQQLLFTSRYQANKHIAYLRTLGCSRITEVQYSDGTIRVMWLLMQ
jgi:hypothetical protein